MGFSLVLAKIVAALVWFGKLAVAVFAAFWLLSTDLGCWVVEQLFDSVIALLNQIDVSGFNQSLSVWGSIPADVLNILGLLGAGEASSIILAAIAIRLAMQVIPFVRLGS